MCSELFELYLRYKLHLIVTKYLQFLIFICKMEKKAKHFHYPKVFVDPVANEISEVEGQKCTFYSILFQTKIAPFVLLIDEIIL